MRLSFTRRVPLVAVLFASACAGGSNSNPTSPTPASTCAVSVSFNTTTFPAEGGSISGEVKSSRSDCGWSFQGPSWVTIVPASGTGAGMVVATASVTVDARSGALLFGTDSISVIQPASVEADRLGFAVVRCHRNARAGASTPGACTITQRPGRNPPSTGIRVAADLTAFGRSADWGLAYVTASAGDWDLDVSVPAGFPAGTVPITFRITDAQGRSATTTVPLVIIQ